MQSENDLTFFPKNITSPQEKKSKFGDVKFFRGRPVPQPWDQDSATGCGALSTAPVRATISMLK